MNSYPNPLIQYLGHSVSWAESYTSRTLSIKFAVNPAAMVEGVQLDLDGQGLLPAEWKYQLVSVSSPGYLCFEVPDKLGKDERFAKIVVVINGQELSSSKFNWKSTLSDFYVDEVNKV